MTHDKNDEGDLEAVLLKLARWFRYIPHKKNFSCTQTVNALFVHPQRGLYELNCLGLDVAIPTLYAAMSTWDSKDFVNILCPKLKYLVLSQYNGATGGADLAHRPSTEFQVQFLQHLGLEHAAKANARDKKSFELIEYLYDFDSILDRHTRCWCWWHSRVITLLNCG